MTYIGSIKIQTNMKVYNANTGEELPTTIEKQIENRLLNSEPYPYDLLYGDN
jgi:hypothetical protein